MAAGDKRHYFFRGTTFNVWRILLQKMADRYFEKKCVDEY